MRNFLKKVTEKFKNTGVKLGKKSQFLLAGILALVMLIIFFNGIKSGNKGEQEKEEKEIASNVSFCGYDQELEDRLERILSSIDGLGEVKAFVMTEASVETIYAGNEEMKDSGANGSSSSVEIVFGKNGSTSTPITKVEIYPQITGVLIVAEGAKDEKLRLLVINAVSVALDIENSKIEVLAGKKS